MRYIEITRAFRALMPKMGLIALLFATASDAAVLAKSLSGCDSDLTIGERYFDIRNSGAPDKVVTVALTHLLNDTFTPFLNNLSDLLSKTSREEITELSNSLPPRFATEKHPNEIDNDAKMEGFDSVFVGEVLPPTSIMPKMISSPARAPYTQFNRAVMERLDRALLIASMILDKNPQLLDPGSIEGALPLIRNHTFAQDEFGLMMYYAHLSIAQSAGQLTADAVAEISADEMLKAALTMNGRMPSLMVLHSLLLPPALIGPYGSKYYMRNALILNDSGRLTFSPEYRRFLKGRHDAFMTHTDREGYELGHGCPVAHGGPDGCRPSLQTYIDAILHIYNSLPE